MIPFRRIKIRSHERGLMFRDGDFVCVLRPGRTWIFDPLFRVKVDRVSTRLPWLDHRDLDVIARSGQLGQEARVMDLNDHQRALVWVDDRLDRVLGPGLHVIWTVFRKVEVEVLDARDRHVQRPDLSLILQKADALMHRFQVDNSHQGLLFLDGEFQRALEPGLHGFWDGEGQVRILHVDLRETVTDVAGQDIMTADKVTLRLNALVTWRVKDPFQAVTAVEDHRQALYREAQLALRSVIGTRTLDSLLGDKDDVSEALREGLRRTTGSFGVEIHALGIRDVILPGEMKELMNKVTEARKASEAAFITRREETAAIRSQANTARLLESNPTLMRLRELEVLERVAEKAQLQVLLGDGGLVEKVTRVL